MEICDYCGLLDWTVGQYGSITHKCLCPNRQDPWCQSHPKLCTVPAAKGKPE